MSRENVEVIDRLVEAWNRRDVDACIQYFDAEAEVVFPPEVPEPGPFVGHEEIRQWMEGFLVAWEEHQVSVEEFLEEGESVVAVLHLQGRGRDSGLETDETDSHVFTFRASKIVSWRNYPAREEALEAVGRSE